MMMKFKFIIPKIGLLLVVGTLFFVYKSKYLDKTELKRRNKVDKVTYFANYLHNIWFVGPSLDDILSCPNLDKEAPINFYRCSREYLDCALTRDLKVAEESFVSSRKELLVSFKSESESFNFKLKKNCQMSYLPQNKYSYGLSNERKFIWDNYNRDFYIDKYYVSNYDVKNWNSALATNFSYKANTNLSLSQKIKFCQSKGKRLLEARFFDAASFIYDKDAKNNYFYKHKTNFTKGRSFLSSKDGLRLKDCYKAFVLGCEKFYQFKNYDNMSLTWIGINYALGGHYEEMINRFDRDLTLKESSMYLAKSSKAHRVGYRTNKKDKEGAFRCMLQL